MGNKRRNILTTKEQIVEYWWNNLPAEETELNFDWSDALEVCWNCGDFTKHTQRCHIIPDMLGGKDVPSNYVLLCEDCHREAPDVHDAHEMWKWIKSNRTTTGLVGSYRMDKILKEFKRRNGFDFIEVGSKIPNVLEKLSMFMNDNKNYVGIHSGKIKPSSMATLYKKFLDENLVDLKK